MEPHLRGSQRMCLSSYPAVQSMTCTGCIRGKLNMRTEEAWGSTLSSLRETASPFSVYRCQSSIGVARRTSCLAMALVVLWKLWRLCACCAMWAFSVKRNRKSNFSAQKRRFSITEFVCSNDSCLDYELFSHMSAPGRRVASDNTREIPRRYRPWHAKLEGAYPGEMQWFRPRNSYFGDLCV